ACTSDAADSSLPISSNSRNAPAKRRILTGSNQSPSGYPFNVHRVQRHLGCRPVLGTTLYLGNLIGDVLAFHHFSKDSVIAGEPGRRRNGDKELAAVGSWAGIRHGELSGLVKLVRRTLGFILEFISRTTHACAAGVAGLDHKVRDHAMKDGAIIQWAITTFAANVIFPTALTLCELNEVFCRNGSLFFKKAADDLSFRRVEDGVCSWLAAHEFFLLIISVLRWPLKLPSLCPSSCLLPVYQRPRRRCGFQYGCSSPDQRAGC